MIEIGQLVGDINAKLKVVEQQQLILQGLIQARNIEVSYLKQSLKIVQDQNKEQAELIQRLQAQISNIDATYFVDDALIEPKTSFNS